MGLASGLGSQFGLAKEVTYGTVVTPDHFYEFDSESLTRQPTYQDSVGLRSGRPVVRYRPHARRAATCRWTCLRRAMARSSTICMV
jgi:hypothetical protein